MVVGLFRCKQESCLLELAHRGRSGGSSVCGCWVDSATAHCLASWLRSAPEVMLVCAGGCYMSFCLGCFDYCISSVARQSLDYDASTAELSSYSC
jgi:hypothetical protein